MALGGMRMPSKSVERLPQSRELGGALRELLESAIQKFPILLVTARGILDGNPEVPELDEEAFLGVRSAVGKLLEPTTPLPEHTARAQSPLDAALMWGWGDLGDDPDAKLLATWVRQGAPLGFEEPIQSVGVFPRATGTPADAHEGGEPLTGLDEWTNWPSAVEEKADLQRLIREAEGRGFCEITTDLEEARQILGGDPVLNKLGVVVKFQGEQQVKKSRIIWDLRDSGVNEQCDPAERVMLPRLLDVVHDIVNALRSGGEAVLAAVDIQDALMPFTMCPRAETVAIQLLRQRWRTAASPTSSTMCWCSGPDRAPRCGADLRRSLAGS